MQKSRNAGDQEPVGQWFEHGMKEPSLTGSTNTKAYANKKSNTMFANI